VHYRKFGSDVVDQTTMARFKEIIDPVFRKEVI
jgi:hypothetical protein